MDDVIENVYIDGEIVRNFLKALPADERKQIENEMLFRRANEKVGDDLDLADWNHIAQGNPELVRDVELLLGFICECSDENCQVSVPLKLSKYRTVHLDRSTFLIKPGHEVKPIEKVIESHKEYSVVRKNNVVAEPKPKAKFNKTSIDNTKL